MTSTVSPAGAVRGVSRCWPGLLSMIAALACASDAPSRPPIAIPVPVVPAGPEDALKLDIRWRAIEVEFGEAPHLDARAVLSQPSIRIFLPDDGDPPKGAAAEGPPANDGRVFRVGAMPDRLQEIIAADLHRMMIRAGELFVVDLARGARPVLWVHELELGIENLATRARLMNGLPTLLTGRGRIGRTGTLQMFVSADPFGHALDFAGRASIEGLDMRELSSLVRGATGLRTPEGRLDVFVSFTSKNGLIRGAVKPLVRGLEVEAGAGGLLAWFKEKAADVATALFSDDSRPRDVLATVIPIEGQLREPDIQVWPAVFGLLYNAFVTGFAAGYAGLPPDRAPEANPPLQQGWRVLIEAQRPRAQPTSASARAATRPRFHRERDAIPVAPSPAGLMRPGAERAVQQVLIRRGLLPAHHLTGALDAPTARALREVQRAAALPETGLPSYATVAALGLDPIAIFQRAARVPGPASAGSTGRRG